ncbi:LysR family transcriptional regulator [Cryptosporangium phraense]|uniref:LysR family transcriptional regulator n=1 Tax=Cryptosporangium phraense TaxID=2593070 RepID=UPI001478BD51|nr:LysR family transcriptional regulator [Cryptosporangium phraense]
MELRQVSSFLALAEELHFGRAAEKLHLSQPSLSQHLQKLERHVGVQLVARSSHSVRLTPAGEAFRRECVRLLAQADLAVEAARWAGSGATGHLRISFNYPAGQRILAPTLTLLRERHPAVRTSLLPRGSLAQLSELREGRVDLALVFGAVDEDGLQQRPIFTLPVVGICASDHPLATGAPVRWPELSRYRCLLPSRAVSPAMHDAILSAARLNGIDLSGTEVFDDGDAAVVLVASQPLVIFTSEARAESVAVTGLSTLSFVDPVPQVTVHAIWRDDNPNPAVSLFLELLDLAR